MLSKRPKIKIRKSWKDRLIEGLTFSCLAACWLIVLISYKDLPAIIPVHYDLKGNVDNYGAKETILLLPLIATAVLSGMYFLNTVPHYFNYMVEITEENAEGQYKTATRLLRFTQLIISVIFLAITIDIIKTTEAGISMLGPWFIPLMAGVLLVPVIWSFIKIKYFIPARKQ